MIKAVLFDFNGTLLVDGDIHHDAWHEMIKRMTNDKFDPSSIKHFPNLSRQRDFARNYIQSCGLTDSDDLIEEVVNGKADLYEQYIVERNRTNLMPGATEFLEYCKSKNIPMVLVTMSIKRSIDFYFKIYGLDCWFDYKQVKYDDGTYVNKALMYHDAAQELGLSLEDCLVIEDSSSPMNEAISMGCKNIIYMRQHKQLDMPEIKQKVNDFTEIDYSIIK